MVTGVLESIGIQLGCQSLGPLLRKLFKLIRKISKAYPEAKTFWETFKREYELLKETARLINDKFGINNTTDPWDKRIKDITAKAAELFNGSVSKIKRVLYKDGYTWRLRWAIVSKDCKRSSSEIVRLNEELLRVAQVLRMRSEMNERRGKMSQDKSSRIGDNLGAVVGGAVVGGIVGYFGFKAAITSAVVCGIPVGVVGIVVGGLTGGVLGLYYGRWNQSTT